MENSPERSPSGPSTADAAGASLVAVAVVAAGVVLAALLCTLLHGRESVASEFYIVTNEPDSKLYTVETSTGVIDHVVDLLETIITEIRIRDFTVVETAGVKQHQLGAGVVPGLALPIPADEILLPKIFRDSPQGYTCGNAGKLHLASCSDDKIETIAREVGYESPFTFSNAFKRWTGRRPSEYRERGG